MERKELKEVLEYLLYLQKKASPNLNFSVSFDYDPNGPDGAKLTSDTILGKYEPPGKFNYPPQIWADEDYINALLKHSPVIIETLFNELEETK